MSASVRSSYLRLISISAQSSCFSGLPCTRMHLDAKTSVDKDSA